MEANRCSGQRWSITRYQKLKDVLVIFKDKFENSMKICYNKKKNEGRYCGTY